MAYADNKMSTGRIAAIVIVAILHALLGYAFVTGLAYNVVKKVAADLKTFNVEEPPPPEEKPPPPPPDQPQHAAAGRRAAADRPDQHAAAAGLDGAERSPPVHHADGSAGAAGAARAAAAAARAGQGRAGARPRPIWPRSSRTRIIRPRRSATTNPGPPASGSKWARTAASPVARSPRRAAPSALDSRPADC
jgi:hypothetical protein